MKKTTFLLPVAFLVILPGCGREALPITAEVEVPFTSQAPAGDWSEPWQNACEETSVYMVSSFYKDDTIKRDEAIKNMGLA